MIHQPCSDNRDLVREDFWRPMRFYSKLKGSRIGFPLFERITVPETKRKFQFSSEWQDRQASNKNSPLLWLKTAFYLGYCCLLSIRMSISLSLNPYQKRKKKNFREHPESTSLWYKTNLLQLPSQWLLLLDGCVPIIKTSSSAVYDALWIYFKDNLSYKDHDEI